MERKPLIIFDMDGVLVDVSGSYREVTRLSVILYFKHVLGARIEDDGFLSLADVAAVKKGGGLNNDWDLTDAIINTYLVNVVPPFGEGIPSPVGSSGGGTGDRQALQAMRSVAEDLNLESLEVLVHERNIRELYGSPSSGKSRPSPYLCNRGDVLTGNLSKRIFQEIYLGEKLFGDIYGEGPLIYHGSGYMEREKMIPQEKELEAIADRCRLSIATGRPLVEASYALHRFGIEDYFPVLISEDDVVRAERLSAEILRKPHPFSLRLCMERNGYNPTERVLYLGDMPDDMIAATRAGIVPIGFVNVQTEESDDDVRSHRALLKESGARHVFGDFEEFTSTLLASIVRSDRKDEIFT
jgi:HAD superfamily hydrolase (TIGR01548 family)